MASCSAVTSPANDFAAMSAVRLERSASRAAWAGGADARAENASWPAGVTASADPSAASVSVPPCGSRHSPARACTRSGATSTTRGGSEALPPNRRPSSTSTTGVAVSVVSVEVRNSMASSSGNRMNSAT